MKIYVVYYIDSDWYSTRHIVATCSSMAIAKEIIGTLEDDADMGYDISEQELDEEFTGELM